MRPIEFNTMVEMYLGAYVDTLVSRPDLPLGLFAMGCEKRI